MERCLPRYVFHIYIYIYILNTRYKTISTSHISKVVAAQRKILLFLLKINTRETQDSAFTVSYLSAVQLIERKSVFKTRFSVRTPLITNS